MACALTTPIDEALKVIACHFFAYFFCCFWRKYKRYISIVGSVFLRKNEGTILRYCIVVLLYCIALLFIALHCIVTNNLVLIKSLIRPKY